MSPKLIYLDQNKWIDLSHADQKTVRGQAYIPLLQLLREQTLSGSIRLPLSSSHIIETYKITDPTRRYNLSKIMVELSGGFTIAPPYKTVEDEIVAITEELFTGTTTLPNVIGQNLAFAFGISEQDLQRQLDTPPVMTKLLLNRFEDPNFFMRLMTNENNRNADTLNAVLRHAQNYARKVETARLNAKAYTRDLRLRAQLAALTIEYMPLIDEVMHKYGSKFEILLEKGRDWLASFVRQSPTIDVTVTLEAERNEHWERRVPSNDLNDLTFLSVAIPQFDVVVTERFWANVSHRTKLHEKYKTVITADALELLKV